MSEPTPELTQALEQERERRQRAEASGEQQRHLLYRLLEALPDYLFLKDRNAIYIACNSTCATLWGVTAQEVIGQSDEQLAAYNRINLLTQDDEEVLRRGRTLHLQELVHFPAGRNIHLECTKSPLRDRSGRIVGLIGVARDAGERYLLHEELKAARRQLVYSGQVRNELMKRIAREIRDPLNAITGLIHLLNRTPLQPTQQEYLGRIRRSSQTLIATIGDILDYSKLESQHLILHPISFQLDVLVEELREVLQPEAEQKQLELLFRVAPEVPTALQGDAVRLRQILYNLITNAIKFTEKGGVIVQIDRRESCPERIRLTFSVKDTGPGLSPEQIQELFNSPNDRTGHAHLKAGSFGLTICHALVELMGGRMQVDSQPLAGSDFHFTALFDPPTSAPLTNTAPPPSLTGRRVLLIDGNPRSRKHLWHLLTDLGLQVEAVAHSSQAEGSLSSQADLPLDLLLIDWRLPDGNGIDALTRLRRHPCAATTPALLLITAYGRDALLGKARQAGIDGFLLKPVEEYQLHQSLSEALRRGHQDNLAATALIGEAERTASSLSGYRVLLAEDDLINREVACELLGDVGMRVVTARSGREALTQLEQENIDLILMDIRMPDLDGLAATRMIRKDQRFREIPIIAMTVHALDEDRNLCLEAGMNDHVTKPFDPEEMYRVLDLWLNAPHHAPREEWSGGEQPEHSPEPLPAEEEDPLPQLPGIDLELALKLTGGKVELLLDMIQLFRRNYATIPAQMHKDLEAGRVLSIFRAAHSMKSAARYIGATELARHADTLEVIAREGDVDKIREEMARFDSAFEPLLTALETFNR